MGPLVRGAMRFGFRVLAKLGVYRRLFPLERPLDEPIPNLPLPADALIAIPRPALRSEGGCLHCATGPAARRRWRLSGRVDNINPVLGHGGPGVLVTDSQQAYQGAR